MILSKVDNLDFETLTHKFETFVSQECQQESEKTTVEWEKYLQIILSVGPCI